MIADRQHDSTEPLSAETILRIDEACDRYEQDLTAGRAPDLAATLQGFCRPSRTALLGELLLIKMHHRQASSDAGDTLVRELRSEHPSLDHDLAEALVLVKDRIGLQSSPAARHRTSLRVVGARSARPLDVICPHCLQACQASLETPAANVTCGACGKEFDLEHDAAGPRSALRRIGHFRLTSRLGMGGCGTVWKAHDDQLDRTVAIKIPRTASMGPDEQERFLQEARAVARLKHPNIVPVHEFGRADNLIYIVGDYVRGESLAARLVGGRPSIAESVALAVTLADALHYAHQQGVVHRDVKPSNILLDLSGSPHVTDFGLAKLERPSPDDVDGVLMGTPAYMSPEQASGQPHLCDPRTDVYALGVVLFELLTGELPFRGDRDMLLHQIREAEPPSPRVLNRLIPRDLGIICLKCLEKPMSGRYQSAEQLAEDLRRFQRGEPIAARPVSLPTRAWRWCVRNPATAAALAMVMILAIAGPTAAVRESALRGRAERAVDEKDAVLRSLATMGVGAAAEDREAIVASPLITKTLGESALSHTQQRLADAAASTLGKRDLACLCLATAILAQSQNENETAVAHFEAAADVLVELRRAEPLDQSLLAAYAYCEAQLGTLLTGANLRETTTDPSGAALTAVDAWSELANAQPENFTYQSSLADAQLRLSLTQALGAHGRHALASAKQSKQAADSVSGRWPDDARQLYAIACEIAGCPPLLLRDPSTGSPQLR